MRTIYVQIFFFGILTGLFSVRTNANTYLCLLQELKGIRENALKPLLDWTNAPELAHDIRNKIDSFRTVKEILQSNGKKVDLKSSYFVNMIADLSSKIRRRLREMGVQFDTITIDERKVFLIRPTGDHPLNRTAHYIKEKYNAKMQFDLGELFELNAAGFMQVGKNQELHFNPSIEAVVLGSIGGTEGHELIHVDQAYRLFEGQPSVFHGIIRGPIQNEKADGVENTYHAFQSLDETLSHSFSVLSRLDQGDIPDEKAIDDIAWLARRSHHLAEEAKNLTKSRLRTTFDVSWNGAPTYTFSIGKGGKNRSTLEIPITSPEIKKQVEEYLKRKTQIKKAKLPLIQKVLSDIRNQPGGPLSDYSPGDFAQMLADPDNHFDELVLHLDEDNPRKIELIFKLKGKLITYETEGSAELTNPILSRTKAMEWQFQELKKMTIDKLKLRLETLSHVSLEAEKALNRIKELLRRGKTEAAREEAERINHWLLLHSTVNN